MDRIRKSILEKETLTETIEDVLEENEEAMKADEIYEEVDSRLAQNCGSYREAKVEQRDISQYLGLLRDEGHINSGIEEGRFKWYTGSFEKPEEQKGSNDYV